MFGKDVDQRTTDERALVALHVLDAVFVDDHETVVVLETTLRRRVWWRLQPNLDRLVVGAVVAELRIVNVAHAAYYAGCAFRWRWAQLGCAVEATWFYVLIVVVCYADRPINMK